MKQPYWKNDHSWICLNHIPPALNHRLCIRCVFSNCTAMRPAFKKKEIDRLNVISIIEDEDLCFWFKCKRGKDGQKALSRKTSKYCSIQCKNDYARHRHALRKKKKSLAS